MAYLESTGSATVSDATGWSEVDGGVWFTESSSGVSRFCEGDSGGGDLPSGLERSPGESAVPVSVVSNRLSSDTVLTEQSLVVELEKPVSWTTFAIIVELKVCPVASLLLIVRVAPRLN